MSANSPSIEIHPELASEPLDSDPSLAPSNDCGEIVAIDDDPMTLMVLKAHLEKQGYVVRTATDGVSGLELLSNKTSVALFDLRMPTLSGLDCLQHVRKHHANVQVIILTASNDIEDAVEAMRQGAFQYVTKPFDADQLNIYVEKAIGMWQVAGENSELKASHSHSLAVQVPDSIGDIHNRLMQQVERIAALDSTVFIGGESGTGKSTIARLIHQKGARSMGPFVTVNCASLPRDLLQSELFGHTKGSFTGAVKDHIGHAEFADGGTLFLDEIGDLPLELQPKLLTFLQDRIVQRLGSTETKKVDVRLIVATHHDLAEMVRDNRFRQDLYFRLVVLTLEIPPLRHREAELPGIARGIVQKVCERQSKSEIDISASAMELLKQYKWPGNIRELENVIERAIAFAEGLSITPEDLLFSEVSLDRRTTPRGRNGDQKDRRRPIHGSNWTDQGVLDNRTSPASHWDDVDGLSVDDDPEPPVLMSLAGMTMEEIERQAVLDTLQACGGNKAKSARSLGISEKSIYNKMRRLKIEFEKTKGQR